MLDSLLSLVQALKDAPPLVAVAIALAALAAGLSRRGLGHDRRFRRSLPTRLKNSLVIEEALESLLSRHRADRAFVVEFHNGSVGASGVPFAKCSVTYERLAYNVPSMAGALKDAPLGLVTGLTRRLLAAGEIRCQDIEELRRSDHSLFAFLSSLGVRSVYAVAVMDLRMTPIGFVGVCYVQRPEAMSDEDMESLAAVALKTCGMLMADRPSACRLPDIQKEAANG